MFYLTSTTTCNTKFSRPCLHPYGGGEVLLAVAVLTFNNFILYGAGVGQAIELSCLEQEKL